MKNQKKTVLVALFAALISAGCFIQIPLPSGIPIVIQDMFALLSGLLLGPLYGGFAVFIFLLLGFAGLPVFSGKAGIAVLLQGPTGGFLVGYLLATIVGGLILHCLLSPKSTHSEKRTWGIIILAVVVSTIVIFVFGVAGFMRVTQKDFIASAGVVLLPFIPGNTIKAIVIVFMVKRFRPIILNYTT